jgi:hypothetical protein
MLGCQERQKSAFTLFRADITSMGQEAKSTGYWRVNNSPTITSVAKHQQTKQKSKFQLAAQGYSNAITMNLQKKKTNRGPRPTPMGLRPQHPGWGGTEGGNAQQHETQAAAQEMTESDAQAHKRTHTSPQAQHLPPQKRQSREQRRQ